MARDFERDLVLALADEMRDDRAVAIDVYGSLCNVDWEHEDGSRYAISWRSAGGLVAEIRDQGEDYLDFYCSGNEGLVTDDVAASLAEHGWRVSTGRDSGKADIAQALRNAVEDNKRGPEYGWTHPDEQADELQRRVLQIVDDLVAKPSWPTPATGDPVASKEVNP